MRLKTIEIHGFKSFPDRVRLDFNDGITAIIGPNGSGKSNIADAVRWVLGEQSSRTLRGGKMEDVIFGGTLTRKPQGVSSVTLMIDNTDRSLDCDSDEVTITRRLYRSGDSEYRINGAQVRLKDVNELLMDTGLGRDGYSIIGQGRISEIISAKSTQRREIFEEAAGISKYRYRKTEAERRLEQAQENLLRLLDILAELDARLGPLKTQSEKARRFLALSGEKKTLEVSVWMHTLGALRRRTAAIEDKLLLAGQEYENANRRAQQLEEDYTKETELGHALTAKAEERRADAAAAIRQVGEAEAQSSLLQNDVSHHERAIEEAKAAIAQSGRSQEDILADIKTADETIARLTAENAALAAQAQEMENRLLASRESQEAHAAQTDALRLRRTVVFEAIESAKLENAASATLLDEGRLRLQGMQDARLEQTKVIEDLQKEEAQCKALLEEISRGMQSVENSLQGYGLKRASRKKKYDEIAAASAQLERQAQEAEQRAKLLSDMEKNMEGFGASVKAVMQQVRMGYLEGVYGPVSSLIRVADEHTLAIEISLGAALQNIAVDNEETAKRAIQMLRSQKAGRATFLPVSSIKGRRMDARGVDSMPGFVGIACDLVKHDARYEGIMASLLGRTVICEDLDRAVEMAKKHAYRFRIVTLDGQVVNAGGAMTGGYVEKSAGLLSRQSQIARLTERARELRAQLAQHAEKETAGRRELDAIDAEIRALTAQNQTYSEDKIRAEAELRAVGQRIALARNQEAQAKQAYADLTERIAAIGEKKSGAQERANQLAAELDSLQEQIAQATALREQMLEAHSMLAAQLSEQKTKIMLGEQSAGVAASEKERLQASLSASRTQYDELTARVERLEEQIALARQGMMALELQAQALRSAAERAQSLAQEEIGKRQKSEERCEQLRHDERQAAQERDGLYREVVRLTEQKRTQEADYETTVARLYDEYEMSLTDAEKIAQELTDVPAANRRLAEIRSRIKSLGDVNVGAIEEYQEVEARHSALSAQVADVENSRKELLRLIGDLTVRMREIFLDKFSKINAYFSQTFHELFGGGSAALELTQGGDVLESGIEISVRPPGKVVKNLAALSGGESAFVAIAIFFAILKVNPAPFCIMDEIEAALDDVNVSKFASYLRTLTGKTQFIAITHRRGTMEEADMLYGVTMQEKGVSKLLVLNVSQLEKEFSMQ